LTSDFAISMQVGAVGEEDGGCTEIVYGGFGVLELSFLQ
jgi:hypothetical protein